MAGVKALPLPPGFTDLATIQTAPLHSLFNVIGVVVDYLPPTRSRNDYMLTVKVQDFSLRNSTYDGEGLKVRIFRPRVEDLPPLKGVGDVILVRNAKLSEFSCQRILLSSFSTTFLVFAGTQVPEPAFKLDYVSGNSKLPCQGTGGQRNTLTPPEQDYIITLKHALNIRPQTAANAPPPAHAPAPGAGGLITRNRPTEQAITKSSSGKFKLVENLQDRVFSDLCVQVIKKFTNNYGNCELYVSDYTANDAMFYYAPPEEKQNVGQDGDMFNYAQPKREWPGPYGKLVLKVTLVEPHASFAQQRVNEGDLVFLQNVKIKSMPNNDNLLEGDMWPDQFNKSKVQIQTLSRTHPEATKVLQRREIYWTGRQAALKKGEQAAPDDESKMTAKQRKNMKKRLKREERRHQEEKEVAMAEQNIQANKHVRCSHIEQPLATIPHILDADNTRHTNTLPNGASYTLPFINAKYHIKARVVDFHPPFLEDFALRLSEAELDADKSEFSQDMTWQESQPRWEWSFALQLEEITKRPKNDDGASDGSGSSRIWLHVGHSEAQFLFGNDVADPSDLRQDSGLLTQLREKLYILWGDLEERKRKEVEGERVAKRLKLAGGAEKEKREQELQEQEPSNLPFNCCLQEYGVLRDGGSADELADWERQYMMFGVVIS